MTVEINGRKVMVCNCERTMEIDGKKLAVCLNSTAEPTIHTQLCRSQIESYERALAEKKPLLVACTQEAPLFSELAAEKEADVAFTNIRERAGWSQAKGAALPKMAALLAEAAYVGKPAGTIPVVSEGVCLVYGAGEAALSVAEQLAGRLSVSLLLSDPSDVIPPSKVNVPIYKGRIAKASGALGSFEIVVDRYAPAMPSSRSSLDFAMERNGAASKCDLIFDMSGGAPLFADAKRRDGYFYVDPNHPAAIAKAMFEISDMVGEFEKPIYVTYQADICAHGRSGKVGCTNCLDNCPVSAITPETETVKIDARICGGCGNCNAVCPTGAVSYTYPRREDVIGRMQILLGAYARAGGADPVLLVHDEKHGSSLISAMSRFGRGLPANVLPFALYSVTELGHDLLLAALTAGAQQVVVLAPPERAGELAALEGQSALGNAFMTGFGHGDQPRLRVVTEGDPDAVEDALWGLPKLNGLKPASFTALGGKREIARTILAKLHENARDRIEILPLPEKSPYGRIHIDVKGCTLCLACVGSCPVDALGDNPDRPMVRFTEAACVQCGICKAVCPENVISLEARYNFQPSALSPIVLNEEEPFACVSCGKPFGAKSSIERVTAQLKGKHWMFQNEQQIKLLQMCDNCRVVAMSEQGGDPFAAGARPRIRTTDDYLRAEEMARKTGRSPDDFLS